MCLELQNVGLALATEIMVIFFQNKTELPKWRNSFGTCSIWSCSRKARFASRFRCRFLSKSSESSLDPVSDGLYWSLLSSSASSLPDDPVYNTCQGFVHMERLRITSSIQFRFFLCLSKSIAAWRNSIISFLGFSPTKPLAQNLKGHFFDRNTKFPCIVFRVFAGFGSIVCFPLLGKINIHILCSPYGVANLFTFSDRINESLGRIQTDAKVNCMRSRWVLRVHLYQAKANIFVVFYMNSMLNFLQTYLSVNET